MCGPAVALFVPAFGCILFGVLGAIARSRDEPPMGTGVLQLDEPAWERMTLVQLRVFRFMRVPLLVGGIALGGAGIFALVRC